MFFFGEIENLYDAIVNEFIDLGERPNPSDEVVTRDEVIPCGPSREEDQGGHMVYSCRWVKSIEKEGGIP
jgi:hypothetical protein